MQLFRFWYLVLRWINWVIFHLKFILNLTLMLIFALYFNWGIPTLYWAFQEEVTWSSVYALFLGNNRQHMPTCAKIISSWVRKVLDVRKEHMFISTLSGTAVPPAFAAGVSLVSIQQSGDWARVSTPARNQFSMYITPIGTRILYSTLF